MFLKIRHDDDSSLVEVLDLQQLFDPFAPRVLCTIPARRSRSRICST